MSEFIVVAFDDITMADTVLARLKRLQKEYLVDLEDAVVAVREADGKVDLKQSVNLVGLGAASSGLSGAFFGGLIGLLFLNPLAGMAIGAAVGAGSGALAGSLSDYGIDDNLIREISGTIKPETSALFLLVRKAQPEKVLSELSQFKGKVIRSSLSPENEEKLQKAISGLGR
ncbi:DUF1269 domain-containing protein [Sinirhodobacter populi]|uniref:DUF1269 domain-containing protein n=1 Tax=Paenirhodobacter populi TaxID=2306993 RepID=A0A443IK52_9RHOB|nr:DUF1269 domain-containing protein [Sinirhodobacter populi]RWR05027.1 DUF1269 domain-containing protein [Sinirhodobacter populi]RWR31517.1 DUF1269 domain-containing protein [Sinirhodobacter populi]